MSAGCRVCGGLRRRWDRYCAVHMAWRTAEIQNWEKNCGRRQAGNAVHKAKAEGRLPLLDGSIPCVDCSAPARQYEHRDYNRPLDVEPVCIRCNRRRGKGRPLDSYRPVPLPEQGAAA